MTLKIGPIDSFHICTVTLLKLCTTLSVKWRNVDESIEFHTENKRVGLSSRELEFMEPSHPRLFLL